MYIVELVLLNHHCIAILPRKQIRAQDIHHCGFPRRGQTVQPLTTCQFSGHLREQVFHPIAQETWKATASRRLILLITHHMSMASLPSLR